MSDKIQQKNIDNKEGTMSTPNFFSDAPEALQDAFIRWLVECATEATNPLHKCGLSFVRALFRSGALDGTRNIPVLDSAGSPMAPYNGRCKVSDVGTPKRQYKNIDVYFQAKVDGEMVSFIIEDKIDSQPGEGQLNKYLDSVIKDTEEKDLIKPVYFKTGYVFGDERESVENDNYSVFGAEDLKNFLARHSDAIRQNQILCHYAEYLNGKIQTRSSALANWDFDQDYVQWEFMQELRDVLRGAACQWNHFVPNALSNFQHEWENSLERDNNTNDGSQYIQYWFSTHLEWRLDAGRPLRLMTYLDNAGQIYNGIQERYRECFENALNQQEGLRAGNAGIVKKGKERTIGSIDTENLRGMTKSKFREFLDRVTRVHIRFLESISADM